MSKQQDTRTNRLRIDPHYSPAVVHNDIVYVSGQLPINRITFTPVSVLIQDQTKAVFRQLAEILEKVGSDLSKVLKLTIYLSDMTHWEIVNSICAEFFGEHKPARTIVPTKILHYNCLIELDAIAYIEKK
ncbi:MAG: RidA family protein [Candidatus Thorarchaeota archaeon]